MNRRAIVKTVADTMAGTYANETARLLMGSITEQVLELLEPMIRSHIANRVLELRAEDDRKRQDCIERKHGVLADAFAERLHVYDDVLDVIRDISDE